MNEISVPMPYEEKFIDTLVSINNQVEKSKITNVYFALPLTDKSKTTFEQNRTFYPIVTDFDYWKKIISYAREKGFEFIYLLNSPRPILYESPYLSRQLEKLDNLMNKFRQEGLNKLRISNIQLMGYVAKHYPEMELYVSTSFEYTQIKQIQNLMMKFPQIKQIVPSHDVNKNFKFLKTIKKQYPKLNIEIMLNEGCLGGCPFRFWHAMAVPSMIPSVEIKYSEELTPAWFIETCTKVSASVEKLCTKNNIYPWEVEEYSKIGINQFKLVGRNTEEFLSGKYLDYYLKYLKGIDNYKNIENEPFKYFINYHINYDWNFKVKEIKPYLPNIKYFIKRGYLCSSICGTDCRYCYKCAENIKKHLKIIY